MDSPSVKLPMAPKAVNIEKEIRQVVDNGEFTICGIS
jgi:hypothetical protein